MNYDEAIEHARTTFGATTRRGRPVTKGYTVHKTSTSKFVSMVYDPDRAGQMVPYRYIGSFSTRDKAEQAAKLVIQLVGLKVEAQS